MEWTSENVINLIDLYRDHPVLWDCRLKEYKNRNKKLDALVEIANFFGAEKDEIERKIKNLVSHLSRELKKEKESMKSGTGADGVYRSKWFCYNNLMFLKERNRPREMTDTLMQDQTTSEEAEVTREEVNEQAEESDLTSEVVGKKRKTSKSPYSSKATEEALSIMKEIQGRSKNVKTDQFTAFGEQVGLRIRDLPSSHSQKMVKHLISNILFEAEMGKYNHSNSFPAPYSYYNMSHFSQPSFPTTTMVPVPDPANFNPLPQQPSYLNQMSMTCQSQQYAENFTSPQENDSDSFEGDLTDL